MSDSFCRVLLKSDTVDRYNFIQGQQYNTPPALIPTINRIQAKYNTNNTEVSHCMSYFPNDKYIKTLPANYNALVYIIRLSTSLWGVQEKDPGRKVYISKEIDVHIYSNPMLHIYAVFEEDVVSKDGRTKFYPLPKEFRDKLPKFIITDAQDMYSHIQTHTSWFVPDSVVKCDTSPGGGMVTDSRKLTRDVMDMLSVLPPISREEIVKASPDSFPTPVTESYPDLVPLCFAIAEKDCDLYIVRFIETLTNSYYDILFSACHWNTSLNVVGLKWVNYSHQPLTATVAPTVIQT